MNARMLWSLCALGLIPLAAGCCCCDAGPRRHVCGNGPHNGCRPHAAPLAKGRLHVKDRVAGLGGACMYGFPPYVPAPLGYMPPGESFTLASTSRHVEIHSVIERPRAPEKLPTVADESAKPLKPEPTPKGAANDTAEDATPSEPKAGTVAQPSLAPRTTSPKPSNDDDRPDAPLPDAAKQPVSVPAPDADGGRDDALPANPLLKDGGPAANEGPRPQPANTKDADENDGEGAPLPKSDRGGEGTTGDDASDDDASDDDASDDVWPDAPLPKNDLPPLAPAS
jgi:hypothetical protein